MARGGGTLGISGWGCATGTLEPLAYTRASSAEFCYPIPYPRVNCLKTIPFTAAHTYIAHIWQCRPRRYGLEDMRGFDSLPDKEPKSVKSTFLTTGVLLDITPLQVSSPFIASPLGYGFNREE